MKIKKVVTRKFRDYTHLFNINPELVRFRQELVLHQVFEECEETILSKIAHPVSFNIVPVVGPSGAGKTQLLNEVAGAVLKVGAPPQSPDEDESGKKEKPPYLPVIYVVAKNGRTFESRYRSLLIEILEQANEVLVTIGKTTRSGASEAPKRSKSDHPLVTPESVSISKLPISRLEALVKSALKERRVRAVLIDEAQHLVPLQEQQKGYGPDLRLIGDGLKLLGSTARTLIVLFGTAELLGLPSVTAQLGRRSQLIHFRRYVWQNPDDQAEFSWVVEQFVKAWPVLLPKALLLNHLELLYAGCVGCVGILSDWLAAAMNKAEQSGAGSVTLEILKQTALRGPRLRKIMTEARDCEKAFKDEEVGPEDMIDEMCGDAREKAAEADSEGVNRNGSNGEHKRRSKLKPGKRAPTYDTFEPRQKAA